jgi:hypothetical protein
MILRIFIVQPRFHVDGARAWEKRLLAAKLARVEIGNSDILDQGDQTKILSYVASFYSKSLAKLLNNHFCRLPPDYDDHRNSIPQTNLNPKLL